MALQKQLVPVSLGAGVDTKNDPKQLPTGKLTSLKNGVFTTGKEIRKRNGYSPLPQSIQSGGNLSSGVAIETYNDELLTLDGQSLYSLSQSTSNWVNKGSLATTTLSTKSVLRNSNQQTVQDSAVNGPLECYTYLDSTGGIRYTILDSATSQSIVNNQLISATATSAKVLSLGSNFVIIFADTNLKYASVSISTPTVLSSIVTIATDLNNAPAVFDATVINNSIYMAYNNLAAKISLYSLSSSLILSSQYNFGSENAACLTVFGDPSGNVWLSYSNINQMCVAAINSALTSVVLTRTVLDTPLIGGQTALVSNITGVCPSTTAYIYYEVVQAAVTSGNPLNFVKKNNCTILGIVGTPFVFNRGVGLASKLFRYNGSGYLWLAFQSALQPSYFLVDEKAVVIAKLSPGNGGGLITASILPEVTQKSPGVFMIASLIKDLLTAQSGTIYTQTGVLSATVTFSSQNPGSIALGQNLQTNGAVLNMYDGSNVVEHGFHVYPEALTTTWSPSAQTFGGGIGLGTSPASVNQFGYKAVYEWTDNQGQLHRSSPSTGLLVAIQKPTITTFTGDFPTANGTTITNASVTPTVGQYVNLCAPSGQVNFPWNATVTSVSGTTITLSSGYRLTASTGNTFILSNFPMSLFFFKIPSPSVLQAGFGTVGGYKGQTLLPIPGYTSNYVAGTYVTDFVSGATNYPAVGGGNTFMYYSLDLLTIPITVPTLKITRKSKVSIALYRTLCNGTAYYRTTSSTSLIYNDPTVDSITINDTTADGSLIGNEELYTLGEIENIAAPATTISTTFKSRAIVVPAENQLSWWYSKQVVPGSPVEFSDSFVSNVDSKIGKITAVGILDEKLILFGPNSKYAVVGSGPSPSGLNNDFSEAQHISGTTGCQNQASLIETPMGLIYQDFSKGIYLLDRSLNEVYIGSDVEAFNGIQVSSAQLIPYTTMLRMTLVNGVVLVFDWNSMQWGDDTYLSPVQDSAIYQNKFTYLQNNGIVLQEAAGFTDNGSLISLDVTTGWISFAPLQGFQRIWRLIILGQYKSPHTLNVNVYADFNEAAPVQTVAIPVLFDPGVYEFRISLSHQKCTAIKIKVFDTQVSSFGEGFSLSGFSFEVGLKQGANKLAAGMSS